jgi:DNA transformation protein
MKPGDAFAEFVAELLGSVGTITLRRMFGGHGIYCDGLMFALIAAEVVYLKTDEQSRSRFEAAGSEPFRFTGARGRTMVTSYWRLPDEALDSPAMAAPWARLAFEAALRRANAPSAIQHPKRTSARKRAAAAPPRKTSSRARR